MRRPLGLLLPVAVAAAIAAPALPVSAATQASIVNCAGQPACFSPNPLTIPAGASVTWTNNASVPHTATADSAAWTTGVLSVGATSAPITFATPGTFAYHCAIHLSMHGTIVVTALAPSGGGPTVPLTLGLGLLAVVAGLLVFSRRPPLRR